MPKQKTHSASKKRFKISGSGKVMRFHSDKKHKLTCKSPRQKRNLRGSTEMVGQFANNDRQMIPYN